MECRFYASRTAARLLLQKLWATRTADTPEEVLRKAPFEGAARLGMSVQQVPGIPGGELVAGEMDRDGRRILISTQFSSESQRFTLAHELGHVILHPGSVYFRDRSLEAPDFASPRPYYEVEADAFAAEFLMPFKHLERAFSDRFDGPLETCGADPDVVRVLNGGRSPSSPWGHLQMSDINRARAVASATGFGTRSFVSLHRQFGVSKTAMAIQLLNNGLVR